MVSQLAGLFRDELNPVAPKAQGKVRHVFFLLNSNLLWFLTTIKLEPFVVTNYKLLTTNKKVANHLLKRYQLLSKVPCSLETPSHFMVTHSRDPEPKTPEAKLRIPRCVWQCRF